MEGGWLWWREGGCGGGRVAVVEGSGCGGGWMDVVEGGGRLWWEGGCGGQWLWWRVGLRGVAIGAEWVDGHGREWRTGDYSDGG